MTTQRVWYMVFKWCKYKIGIPDMVGRGPSKFSLFNMSMGWDLRGGTCFIQTYSMPYGACERKEKILLFKDFN